MILYPESIDTPAQPCPSCEKRVSQATPMEGGTVPKPGDVSVCMRCQAVLIFNRDLSLRVADAADMMAIRANERVSRLVDAARSASWAVTRKPRG